MKLKFVTKNKHKFEEVSRVLQEFGIELEQRAIDYEENHDESVNAIAKGAAKKLAEQFGEPVMVDDTGIFFEAYDNFPGALPKFVFNSIGYDGIFKLLEGMDRTAYFLCCIGYCEPGKEPMVFEGKLYGKITTEVHDPDMDILPYERIFIANGYDRPMSQISREEKNKIGHRGEAARKLGEYLSQRQPI